MGLNFWPEFVGRKSVSKRSNFDFILDPEPCLCSPELALTPASVSKVLWVLGMSLCMLSCRLSDLITFWIYKKGLHKRGSPNVLFKATGALVNHHFFGSFRLSSAVHHEMVYLKSLYLALHSGISSCRLHGCGQKSGDDKHSDENWYQELLWRHAL